MKIGRIVAVALLCLWLAVPAAARAEEAADDECPVTLCVTFRCGETPLRDMEVPLYLAAIWDAQGELAVTASFAPFAAAVRGGDEAVWHALAEEWETHIAAVSVSPAAVGVTDGDGCVRFGGEGEALTPGLYFVPGIRCAAEGGRVYQTQPFSVLLDGCDMAAWPKCAENDDPRLPQTGQLWWPVPLLAAAGLALLTAGLLCRKGQRHG